MECATTLVAAELESRYWVGIDIWKGAKDIVIDRLEQKSLETSGQDQLALDNQATLNYSGKIDSSSTPPERTDDGLTTLPFPVNMVSNLESELHTSEYSRSHMFEKLVQKQGLVCQGCQRKFDSIRYLHLEHDIVRTNGGLNHISNRILLCEPCKILKNNCFDI